MVAASGAKAKTLLNWSELIPDAQWSLYREALKTLQDRGLRFALGGGLAFSAYSRRWRNTKDMDIYILPEDNQAVIAALLTAGFEDYYSQSPYDRSWSYRSFRDGVILDVLWEMANHITPATERWLTQGEELEVRGMRLKLLPVEELLWVKLYVFQRDRFDWPDLFNLLYAQGAVLDWQRLVDQVGEDAPLLGAVLSVFGWMCPSRAREFPEWIWDQIGIPRPPPGPDCSRDRRRVRRLDSRDWFGPTAG